MDIKKIFIIFLILVFLIAPLSYADDGDYKLPRVVKDITVNDDGSTRISEDITYDIDGYVNGVYRDLPHNGNQTITNISVETPGYYNRLEIVEENTKTKIKVWLYKDEAKTIRVHDEEVQVIYKYTFNKGVKIYNDIAELQYMTWGDEWDTKVNYLESNIHIPGSNEGTEYWNNPDDFVISSEWTDSNTWTTISENILSETSYEQRILLPKSYFKSSTNAQIIEMDAKEQIEQDQLKYEENRNFHKTIGNITVFVSALLMILPLGIYGLFGREPKIAYKAEYESDLPTDAAPIEVNSIVIGEAGEIDDNGIYATLMDLINRKFFTVIASNEDDTIIRQTDKDTSNLKKYEKSLIEFLSKFAVNGDISLKSIADKSNPTEFMKFKNGWIEEAKEEVPDSEIESFFEKKGSTLFKILSAVIFVLAMVLIVFSSLIDFPPQISLISVILSIVMIVESIIMMSIPNTFAGRWTPEGKEFHDKWKNFEKYLKDYSLIKEYPPASIQVWGKYLVYAAALGCADEVTRNMKQYFDVVNISEDYYYNSHTILFAYYGGFNHLTTTFTALTPSDSASGGIGSVGGGGFGGGGGGTF